jgi:streptomycin 6-kinase
MTLKFPLPTGLVSTTTEQRGPEGVEWLKKLPNILAECERRWALTISPPFPELSYNYTAPATHRDGTPLVVKAGFSSSELRSEADALRLYAGRGAARLLDFDPELAVLLIERVAPGTMLISVKDDSEATSIAASVMKRLRRPVTAEEARLFPTVGEWAQGLGKLRERFGGGTGPFREGLVDQAEGLYAELLPSMGEPVLLHGDLHHYNILAAEREPWLAIDPQGVIGEAEYETGALLRNPTPDVVFEPDLPRLLSRRMDQLAEELGYDRERIWGWAVAQAVLSAWWYIDDAGLNNQESESFKGALILAEAMAAAR